MEPNREHTLDHRAERRGTVLVVEDEEPIRELLATSLRFTGFAVEPLESGARALSAIRNHPVDLVVLDVNLPDLDGFSVCRKIRSEGITVPVVFLTARDDPADLRVGFMGGGDDYLTKPFSLEELVLRIEAVLRRRHRGPASQPRFTCGPVSLDQAAYRVWRDDDEVSLSRTEFRLLHYLMLNHDQVVSKNQIVSHVWEYDFVGDPALVETYISYLRRKLGDREARLIRTVRGFGYSLRTPEGDRTGEVRS